MSAMGQSSDALIRLVTSQPEIADQLAKWGQTKELSGIPLLSPQLLQDAWYGELSRHADTYGLKFANSIPYVHIWARAGTSLILGHRFCTSVTLRAGVLPSKAVASHGRPDVNSDCDHCGPGTKEWLGHILQTSGPRIHRHDLLVHKLARMFKNLGFNYIAETQIKNGSTFCKPDLVIWNSERSAVLDV